MRPAVLFRVDASAAMGMGHLMRCIAVAEAVIDSGGHALFAMANPLPKVRDMVASMQAELVCLQVIPGSESDLQSLLHLIHTKQPICTVIDGYHLTDTYLRVAAKIGPLAVLWDSCDHADTPADVIIDASANADPAAYGRISPKASLLLGPHYALIRRDIRQAMKAERKPLPMRQHLVMSFGGSDPLNLSMAILPELRSLLPEHVHLTVLAGSAYTHQVALKEMAQSMSPQPTISIDPPQVGNLFIDAGFVVSAAGGTIGELVALGLPALSVIVADNQMAASVGGPYPCIDGRTPNAPKLISADAARLWNDLPRREQLVQNLHGLIDGQGALRVASALLALPNKERFDS